MLTYIGKLYVAALGILEMSVVSNPLSTLKNPKDALKCTSISLANKSLDAIGGFEQFLNLEVSRTPWSHRIYMTDQRFHLWMYWKVF